MQESAGSTGVGDHREDPGRVRPVALWGACPPVWEARTKPEFPPTFESMVSGSLLDSFFRWKNPFARPASVELASV